MSWPATVWRLFLLLFALIVVFYLAPDKTKVIFKKCEKSSAFYQKRFDDTQHVDARLCFEKALERESKDN